MKCKWPEIENIEKHGYSAFSKTEVIIDGNIESIYELNKGNYSEGFKCVRARLEEIELLTRLDMTNNNTYEAVQDDK